MLKPGPIAIATSDLTRLQALARGDTIEAEQTPGTARSWAELYQTGAIGRRYQACSEVLGEIRRNQTIHVVSLGGWSAEHMIAHVAERIGPADLLMASWGVATDAIHRLCDAIRARLITSCRALFDTRVPINCGEALALITTALPAADIRLTATHAKVYLLRSGAWHVTILGSFNLTANPRIEAAVITEGRDVWQFHHDWLTAVIDGADPFEPAGGTDG